MEQPKIMQIAHKGSGGQKGYIHCTEGIVGCCTATDYKDPKYILELTGGDTLVKEQTIIPCISSAQAHATVNDDLSPALTAAAGMGGGQTAMVVEPPITVIGMLDISSHDHSRRVHDPEGISPTATAVAGGTHHIKIFDYSCYRVRKLTPTEYGRLQGFPMDSWVQAVSNSQAYKQFGNAVTTTVAKGIATNIIAFLDSTLGGGELGS